MTNDQFRDLLPPLSTDELAALRADIKEHGVLMPIFVDEEGQILDGRHRNKIDPKAKRIVVKGLTDAEKQAFVFRANFTRRNLSPAQKKEALKKMKGVAVALRKEDSKKWTQRKVAAALGVAQQTVADWFAVGGIPNTTSGNRNTIDARVTVPPAQHEVIAERVQAGESQEQVAADYGVGQPAISKIVRKCTEVAAEAKRVAELPSSTPSSTEPVTVLLADPPWQYDFSETDSRSIDSHYPSASVDAICKHITESWAPQIATDCVLFLWATAPKLREALQVMEEWGFAYKTQAVWDKEVMGMGYWFRGQHEIILVGTVGSPSPPAQKLRCSSVFRSKRGKHSAKPACVYDAIEKMFPGSVKGEMYQRKPRAGWVGFGNA